MAGSVVAEVFVVSAVVISAGGVEMIGTSAVAEVVVVSAVMSCSVGGVEMIGTSVESGDTAIME